MGEDKTESQQPDERPTARDERRRAAGAATNQGEGHPCAGSTLPPGGGSPMPGASPSRSPGDDAAAGTVGTGEDVCPRCGGSGKITAGAEQDCPDCGGTGIIIQGIGGG